MFGQNNDQTNDHIPEDSIQGALHSDDDTSATQSWGHPGVPIDPEQSVQAAATLTPAPVNPPTDQPQAGPADPVTPASDSPSDATNDLIDIKQKALTQLSPLVSHLDQPPEEKFRTTMMMIQASDDQALIPVAYEAANTIQDEKAKAQALLDIVNEINYFTQHHQG